MMFSSLRARLWLSYALLIAAAMAVTTLILIIYLIRSPLIHRETFSRLDAVATVIKENSLNDISSTSGSALQAVAKRYDQTFDVRVIVITTKRQVLVDSRAESLPPLPAERIRLLRTNPTIRDENNQLWLAMVNRINKERWLVLATPRPKIPLLVIMRDEVFLPFLEAGALALLLSLLVAYYLARWVADPLQDMLATAHAVPARQTKPLPLKGPREVKDLTRAFNDMTARVQTSQKSQRDFVANVSHELKTPLTSIQGFAQAILDGTANTPKARQQAASVIHNEAGRMQRMVADLLDLARLDAGTLDFNRATVNVAALLNSVVERFTLQAQQCGIILEVKMGEPFEITGDGDRLAQVFNNLVDNALKFTPAGGRITLQAALKGDRAELSVADTGAGIPKEAQPYIFDRFYQADPSRRGGEKHGAGLGLAIAREIVHAHGGTIIVRSAANQGSQFIINLPLTTPDASTVVSKSRKS